MNAPKWMPWVLIALFAAGIAAWLGGSRATPSIAPAAPTAVAPVPVDRQATTEAPARIAVPDGAEPEGIVVVHGRVIDAFGDPLAQALVGEEASDQPVTTRGDGGFDLRVAAGARAVALLVLARDHAPARTTIELGRDECIHDAGDLQLVRGGSVVGRVVDERSQAVPGAVVTIQGADQLVAPAIADASGAFSFVHVPPGACRVRAEAPGMRSARSPPLTVRDGFETIAEPLVLGAGHALSGRVLDPDDRPVVGAAVRIRGESATETDDDGRFGFDALPPGPLALEVVKAGFLTHRAEVDATHGTELAIRLARGLRICGTVVDAATGRPVERFAASVRRIGELDPQVRGSIEQQLARRIDELRAAAAADPEHAADRLRLAAELEPRLAAVERFARSRPIAVPNDVGSEADRPRGRFEFDGLDDEGVYAVGIAAPEHAFAQVEPVEVWRDRPAPDLRIELRRGHALSGRVTTRGDRAAVAGAAVELVAVVDAVAPPIQRSLYPWLFAPRRTPGVPVVTTRTGGDGRFEFRAAAPGRYFVTVRHPRIGDHDTDPFELGTGTAMLRIEVGARASLRGRVGNVPPAQRGNVSVLVLGGHGTQRIVRADADGAWRCDDLQPGGYLVRAFPTDASQYVNRLFGALFPLHAGAVDPDRVPPLDVVLADGEKRELDLALDLALAGAVEGFVSVNGLPATGGSAILRPVPGEAPGAGGLSLRGRCDDRGRFAIGDVPAGRYTLALTGASRQELEQRELAVAPGETASVVAELVAGGLRGRVTAADPAADTLRGTVWVLPGASEAPADPFEYRRSHRTHRIRVRNGQFEDDALTPGPAIVLVDLEGHLRSAIALVVPAGATMTVALVAGARQR